MASKAVIAIVAAIIIVAGGASAYLLMNGNSDSPEKKTDILRTDLSIGDYIETTVEISSSSEYETQSSANLFLYTIYPDIYDIYVEKGQKTVTYKGQSIVCTIYGYEGMSYGYYMNNGVCYGNYYGSEDPMETLLVDTSFDLSKTKAQQEIKTGSFIKSSTNMGEISFTTTNTASTFNEETQEWNITVKAETNNPITSDEKQTVTGFDGGKVIVESDTTGTETVTKADFLSTVSYSNMIQYFKEEGYKYELGKKTSETIDTAYGKRVVDVQTITYTDSGDETLVKAYYCGDVIYQIYVESMGTSAMSKLTSTSLITPAN